MSWYSRSFAPYVPVAERRRKAQREMAKLAKKGKTITPVRIEGKTIARTFWGKAWCDNLESYMDFENRLPRGRTYVRNGSVVHLDIQPGIVEATVSGSSLYQVRVTIEPTPKGKWRDLCKECAGGIGSLVELLQGRFSNHVMGILTRKQGGLFPAPAQIKMKCSCPDWATMCKHVAAVLYGVGARLDERPELLFTLRSVDQEELVTQAAQGSDLTAKQPAAGPELAEGDLGAVFGIEIDSAAPASPPVPAPAPKPARRVAKKKAPRRAATKPKPKASKTPARKARGVGDKPKVRFR
jgi:uncharacterized Zn finger protein